MRQSQLEMDLGRDLDIEFTADVALWLRRNVDASIVPPAAAFYILSELHDGMDVRAANKPIVRFGSLQRRIFIIRLKSKLLRVGAIVLGSNCDRFFAELYRFLDPVIRQPVDPISMPVQTNVTMMTVGTVTTLPRSTHPLFTVVS